MKKLKFKYRVLLIRLLPGVGGLVALISNILLLRFFGESVLLVDVRMLLSLMVASASAYYTYLMFSKCVIPAINFDEKQNFAIIHASVILGSFLLVALLWLGIYFAV